MNNQYTHIEFIKTPTPGPYGIPLKIIDSTDERILFEIEIDGVFHSFPIETKYITAMISDSNDSNLAIVEIDKDAMGKLFKKISSVVSNSNTECII